MSFLCLGDASGAPLADRADAARSGWECDQPSFPVSDFGDAGWFRQDSGHGMDFDDPWNQQSFERMDPNAVDDTAHVPTLKWQFYKTKLCPWHAKDSCFKGDACHFAHGEEDLRISPNLQKTRMCIYFMKDKYCREGLRCNFAHGLQELRATSNFWKTKLCPLELRGKCLAGKNCRYAHSKQELRPPYRSSSTGSSNNTYESSDRLMCGSGSPIGNNSSRWGETRSFSAAAAAGKCHSADGINRNKDAFSAAQGSFEKRFAGDNLENSPLSSASTSVPCHQESFSPLRSWADDSAASSAYSTPKTFPVTVGAAAMGTAAAPPVSSVVIRSTDGNTPGAMGVEQQHQPVFVPQHMSPVATAACPVESAASPATAAGCIVMAPPAATRYAAATVPSAFPSVVSPTPVHAAPHASTQATSSGSLPTFQYIAAFPTSPHSPASAAPGAAASPTWFLACPPTATAATNSGALTNCFVLPAAAAFPQLQSAQVQHLHQGPTPTPQQQAYDHNQRQQWAGFTALQPALHAVPQQQSQCIISQGMQTPALACVSVPQQLQQQPQIQHEQQAATAVDYKHMEYGHTTSGQLWDFYGTAGIHPDSTGSGTSTPSTATTPTSIGATPDEGSYAPGTSVSPAYPITPATTMTFHPDVQQQHTEDNNNSTTNCRMTSETAVNAAAEIENVLPDQTRAEVAMSGSTVEVVDLNAVATSQLFTLPQVKTFQVTQPPPFVDLLSVSASTLRAAMPTHYED